MCGGLVLGLAFWWVVVGCWVDGWLGVGRLEEWVGRLFLLVVVVVVVLVVIGDGGTSYSGVLSQDCDYGDDRGRGSG